MVHFQQFEKCKFIKLSRGACPRNPLHFFGTSPRRSKDRTLAPFVQSPASISLFGNFKDLTALSWPKEKVLVLQELLKIIIYFGVTSSILIGYKHAANSCLLCFSYIIPTDNRFCICGIDVIPTDNSFMHADVMSPNTLTSREEKS